MYFFFACFYRSDAILSVGGNLRDYEPGSKKVILGSTFDWKDIACYAVGCVLIFLFERILSKEFIITGLYKEIRDCLTSR